MVRGLVRDALESRGFRVTAVESARRAIRDFDAIDPDVLITDIDLGTVPDGVQLAQLLFAQAPYLGVVFLTNYPSLALVEGAKGELPNAVVVHKGSIDGPDALCEAVESSLRDHGSPMHITPDVSDDPIARLSPAQIAVLRLIAEGWSNAQVAERRGITPRSAERIIARLFAALGIAADGDINPRVAATRMYVRAFGVPEPPPRRAG